jgi:hypothetical protein
MPDNRNKDLKKINDMIALWQALSDRFERMRRESLRNYEYIAGEQISRKIRTLLEESQRPALVYNLLQPLIIYVAGTLSANRSIMRAYPIREGDEERADMHTTLVSDWAMEQCQGYREIAKAGMDAMIGKVGWLNNYWTTRDNAAGSWVTESFDPFMIMWDADGRKKDQSDWRYQLVSGYYSYEEVLASFDLEKKVQDEVKKNALTLEGTLEKGEKPRSFLSRAAGAIDEWWSMRRGRREDEKTILSDMADLRSGLYRVMEFHEKRWVDHRWMYSAMTGQKLPFPDDFEDKKPKERDEWVEMAKRMMPGGHERVFLRSELWITACAPILLPDALLLERPYPVQGRGFQHKPIWCYDFHTDLTRVNSIIDALIDPQDSFNQRRMSFLEALMDAVNPNYLAVFNTIPPDEEDNWKSKKRHVLKYYKGINAPKREEPAALVGQLDRFSEEDRQIIEIVSGISPNLQGRQQSSGESGVLYARRIAEGLKMLSLFFDQVTTTQQHVFNYCDRNLQEFMTLPRMIRLLSKDGDPNWLQLNWQTLKGVKNDIAQGEFDFKPDVTQAGSTIKQLKFIEALEFVKILPPQLVNWPEVIELWDSPARGKMKKYAEERMGLLQQEQEQKGQIGQVQALVDVLDKLGLSPAHAAKSGGGGEAAQPAPAAQPEAISVPVAVQH